MACARGSRAIVKECAPMKMMRPRMRMVMGSYCVILGRSATPRLILRRSASADPRASARNKRLIRDAMVGSSPTMTLGSVEPQHQADVLHGRAGGALAEIVEAGDEHRMRVGLVAEDAQLQAIAVVERLGLETLDALARGGGRHNADKAVARIMRRQRRLQVARRRLSRQQVEME